MSKSNLLTLESLQTKLQQISIQSNVNNIQHETNIFCKNIQHCWLNLCTVINRLFHALIDKKYHIYLKICLLFLSIIILNLFVTTYFTILAAQFTIGLGGNILYWHHPYITPDISHNKTIKINNIIHQTYKTFDSIPDRWQRSIQTWKQYHPDWQYMFWSDNDIDNFINEHYSWFIPFYYQYPNHIQRVDVARYFILYHFGGIYCDLDIAPRRNIEPLLSNNIDVFIVETPNLGTTNSLFGATKGSNFLFYVINHLHEYYNTGYYQIILPKHMKILFSTGPTMFWALYGRYYSHSIGNDRFGILNSKYFGRLPVCYPNPGKSNEHTLGSSTDGFSTTVSLGFDEEKSSIFGCDMTSFKQSYFAHVEGNSWHNNSSWYINYFLGCQPITTLFMFGIIGWIFYNGIYINKYKHKKTFTSWCRKNFVIICGAGLFIFTMYCWRSILFHIQNVQCN